MHVRCIATSTQQVGSGNHGLAVESDQPQKEKTLFDAKAVMQGAANRPSRVRLQWWLRNLVNFTIW